MNKFFVEKDHPVSGSTLVFDTNCTRSCNGQVSHQQNITSTSETIAKGGARRSIFDHLRENFRLSNDKEKIEGEKIPSQSVMLKKQIDEIEITSSTQEADLNTKKMPSTTQVSDGVIYSKIDNRSNGEVIFIEDDDDNDHNTVYGSDVFPFTERLKWMSQRSREGSPLPQQLPHEATVPSYHGSHNAANQMPSDANRTGFTSFFGQSISSNSGPVSLHLHNGGIGNMSSGNTMPVSRNDVYLILDPQTTFVKGNYSDPVPSEQDGTFLLQTERSQIRTCTPFTVSTSLPHETQQNNPHEKRFCDVETLTNCQNVQFTRSPLHLRESKVFSDMWEMSTTNLKLPPSSPLSHPKTLSAFSSPDRNHQPRGNSELQGGQRFDSSSYQRDNSLSCRESLSKSPNNFSIGDQLFRPVSPAWTKSLYSNSVMLSSNQSQSSIIRTTDSYADDFSYACALHESANSPDIERMLGSESPDEGSSSNSAPSACESKSTEIISDSESVREPNCSNSSSSIVDSTQLVDESNEIKDGTHLEDKDLHSSFSAKTNTDASQEPRKKRKMNLNVIHKRLEPKLPSPVREISSGDLFQDPSKLTREERALQRAMMRFSELEMKEKVAPVNVLKSKRDSKSDEPQNISSKKRTVSTETEKKQDFTSNTIKVTKRKHKRWLKKHQRDLKITPVISSNVEDNVERLSDENKVQTSTFGTNPMVMIKKKVRKRKKLKDNGQILIAKKKKFMNEVKKQLNEKVVKTTVADVVEDARTVDTTEDFLKTDKKETKKLKLKRKPKEKHEKSKAFDKIYPIHSSTTPSSQNVSSVETSSLEKKRCQDEKHRVKTYMLVPSYQGFKDFQPVVIESRTRRKTVNPSNGPDNKPKIPLLVVESVHSKPVKEMIVAESEEVQKLVTECLRVHGKWHGDELEQALKREEAELNEEVTRFRDAKKLSVNRTTGETILHKAARLGYDEIVKQCILQGADPNAKDNAGWTPLHEACARGKLAVVKVLTRYGADVNSQSNDGIRPIHDAAEAGHIDVLRVLLSYGADPFLVTYAGLNATACARHPKVKTFFHEYCTDIGQPTREHSREPDGWEFGGSNSAISGERPSAISGIWDDIPDCSEIYYPEFEISDKPHINTYNLPVMKDDVIVGRRNYMLIQELHDSGYVAKTTLQKKLKNAEILEMPWSEFLEHLSENHMSVKPSFAPEGTSRDEPKAQLVPLNYTMRRLLGIRVESYRVGGCFYKF